MKNILLLLTTIFVLSGCGLLANGNNDKGFAYIYENKETGKLLFCKNDQGKQVRDFKYVGTGQIKKSKIVYCELEKQ